MKIKTLTLVVLTSCLALPALHAGNITVGIGIGGHDRWGHRAPFYGHKAHHPPLIVETSPIVVEERVVTTTSSDDIPYGFLSGGTVRSPWSDFSMSVGGKTSGQVIYDPNTGQAFRVP